MALIDESKYRKKKKTVSTAILDEQNIITIHEQNKKREKVISSFAEIIPVVDITDYDFFEMRNGECMEIVQVTSKDIYSLNESDKDNDIFSLAYLFQAFTHDFKIVPLSTPVNLELQKNNLIRCIRKCKVPEYVQYLEKKLAELEFIEKNRTNREYFIFLYADDTKTLLERKMHIKKLLVRSNPVIELGLEKKLNVLYQLFNPNSKPKID